MARGRSATAHGSSEYGKAAGQPASTAGAENSHRRLTFCRLRARARPGRPEAAPEPDGPFRPGAGALALGGAGGVGGDRRGGGGPRPGHAGASSTSGAAARGRPRPRGPKTCSTGGSAGPIGEFFAVTLEAPAPLRRAGPPRAVLDSLLAALTGEPYVRGLVSYPCTGDTTFLSRDRRSTFVIVALDAGRAATARARWCCRLADAGAGDAGAHPERRRATARG